MTCDWLLAAPHRGLWCLAPSPPPRLKDPHLHALLRAHPRTAAPPTWHVRILSDQAQMHAHPRTHARTHGLSAGTGAWWSSGCAQQRHRGSKPSV